MELIVSANAQKDIDKLPLAQATKIVKKLRQLAISPFSGKALTGELKGYYSLRAWPYRIIYQFRKDIQEIRVLSIKHRQGAYK